MYNLFGSSSNLAVRIRVTSAAKKLFGVSNEEAQPSRDKTGVLSQYQVIQTATCGAVVRRVLCLGTGVGWILHDDTVMTQRPSRLSVSHGRKDLLCQVSRNRSDCQFCKTKPNLVEDISPCWERCLSRCCVSCSGRLSASRRDMKGRPLTSKSLNSLSVETHEQTHHSSVKHRLQYKQEKGRAVPTQCSGVGSYDTRPIP